LEHLKELSQLENLYFTNCTGIADTDTEHIKDLTQLHILYFDHTKVTDEGLKKLRLALPNCKIVHDGQRVGSP
jgi:hypothetical protein